MSLSNKDQILCPVYVIIGNLEAKTCQSQNQLGTLLLDFLPIIHKQSEDSNNKDRDLNTKIYYLALKTMLEHK